MSGVPRTILLVDDAEDCVATLDLALQAVPGVTVISAPSAEHALPLLDSDHVAALVTDLHLPSMTGMELIAYVREQPRHRSLPIIVVSATPDPSASAQAFAAGANAFFAKPFSPGALRKKLEELIHAS